MIEIIVGNNENGQRLDRVLEKIFINAGTGFIFKMLRKKNITLDDKKATGGERLKKGSSIKLWFSDESIEKLSGKSLKNTETEKRSFDKKVFDFKANIIYEDENTILVNKGMGILSQKAKPGDISVNEYLLDYLKYDADRLNTFTPSICNRLDRNTTGILICGKSLEGLRVNNELIKMRRVDKYYLAFVKGIIKDKKSISGRLLKDKASNKVIVKESILGDGDFIETEYEPLKNLSGNTLLCVKLITGKSHQIRAHLSSIGHPILGDYKYGDREVNAFYKEKYGIKSQLLHACKLVYPKTADSDLDKTDTFKALKGRTFFAEYNEDFRKVIGDGYMEEQRA